jgi:hypothetical protein
MMVERLLEVAPDRYQMVKTPLPLCNYIGDLKVEDNGDRTSTVI